MQVIDSSACRDVSWKNTARQSFDSIHLHGKQGTLLLVIAFDWTQGAPAHDYASEIERVSDASSPVISIEVDGGNDSPPSHTSSASHSMHTWYG